MIWELYDLKKCCPDLSNECSKIAPLLNFNIVSPTTTANNDGQVNIEFIGLNKTYHTIFQGLGVNEAGTTIITRTYSNLTPGTYTLTVKPDPNSVCSYTYIFVVPNFITLNARLRYANGNLVPQHPDSASFSIPNNVDVYWNNDNIITRQSEGTTQCYTLEITGGQSPYLVEYQDFLSYTSPAVYLTNGIPIDLDNETVVGTQQRPPIILDKVTLNDNNSLSFCVNLAYNYGNGWVKVIVRDSSNVPQEFDIWLYLKQTIL